MQMVTKSWEQYRQRPTDELWWPLEYSVAIADDISDGIRVVLRL